MRWRSFAGAVSFALAAAAPAVAYPGQLDPSFGHGGVLVARAGGADQRQGVGVAALPGGGLAVAGQTGVGFSLTRFTAAGKRAGRAVARIGDGASAQALVAQPGGGFVVAGRAPSALGQEIVLARFDAAGAPDPGFGIGGLARGPGVGAGDEVALAVDSAGRLIAASGSCARKATDPRCGFVVARYDSHGALDPSFGDGGVAHASFGRVARATALVARRDGGIDVAGQTGRDFNCDQADIEPSAAYARLRADGSLDPAFGSGGTVRTRDRFVPHAVAAGPAGGLVAAGGIETCGSLIHTGFAVIRYRSDGGRDPAFGRRGIAFTGEDPVLSSYSGTELPFVSRDADALAVEPGGGILAAGKHRFGVRGSAFATVRFLRDGSIDPRFGACGRVAARLPEKPAVRAIARLQGRRLALAGDVSRDGRVDLALVRLRLAARGPAPFRASIQASHASSRRELARGPRLRATASRRAEVRSTLFIDEGGSRRTLGAAFRRVAPCRRTPVRIRLTPAGRRTVAQSPQGTLFDVRTVVTSGHRRRTYRDVVGTPPPPSPRQRR